MQSECLRYWRGVGPNPSVNATRYGWQHRPRGAHAYVAPPGRLDTPVFREFAKIGEGVSRLPDETTILRFRHLLERHNLTPDMLRLVNDILGGNPEDGSWPTDGGHERPLRVESEREESRLVHRAALERAVGPVWVGCTCSLT
jgi:hypothetical protein